MLHITSLDDGLDIFKALGSDVRIEIIKLLIENKEMNMNELAAKLNITNGALTGHIKNWRHAELSIPPMIPAGTETRKSVLCIWIKFSLIWTHRKKRRMFTMQNFRSDITAIMKSIRPVGWLPLPIWSVKWMIRATLHILIATMQIFSGFPKDLWNMKFQTLFQVPRKSRRF